MRQLRHEGWMHNRGRLLTASFLTKTLYVGLADRRPALPGPAGWTATSANNQLNWQWSSPEAAPQHPIAPNRVLNPGLPTACVAAPNPPRGEGHVAALSPGSSRWVPLATLEGSLVRTNRGKLKGLERVAARASIPIRSSTRRQAAGAVPARTVR
ncbi:FAD-binding domain-containing protein [Streptomyces sp. L7]